MSLKLNLIFIITYCLTMLSIQLFCQPILTTTLLFILIMICTVQVTYLHYHSDEHTRKIETLQKRLTYLEDTVTEALNITADYLNSLDGHKKE